LRGGRLVRDDGLLDGRFEMPLAWAAAAECQGAFFQREGCGSVEWVERMGY
jgi:hypothetical protein